MRKVSLEVVVGVFVVLGMLSLAVLSVKFGRMEIVGGNMYPVFARFDKAGGIKPGALVEIAGVEVGKVRSIELDEDYQALVELAIAQDVKLQEDAIVSVKTKGLIGEKYIQISPGGFEEFVTEGGELIDTESAIDIEGLISNYVFGKI